MKYHIDVNMEDNNIETTQSSERIIEQKYSKKTLRKLQSDVCSKLKCGVCPDSRFTSLKMYDEHLKSKKHLRKEFRKETASVWRCQACEITMPNDDEWVKHLTGSYHDKMLRSLSLQRNPTSEVVTPKEIACLDDALWQEEDED